MFKQMTGNSENKLNIRVGNTLITCIFDVGKAHVCTLMLISQFYREVINKIYDFG